MKNLSEKSDFDRFWEDAFSEAEMAPSDRVWDRIDASLSKAEAGKYRKRIFIYKLLAAASVAFALGIGGLSLNYYLKDKQAQELAGNQPYSSGPNESIENNDASDQNAGSGQVTIENGVTTAETVLPQRNQTAGPSATSTTEVTPAPNAQFIAKNPVSSISTSETVGTNRQVYLPDPLSPKGIDATESAIELVALASDHMYMIPVMPRGSSKKMQNSQGVEFIAGLDFSTGLFDPNFGSGGSSTFSDANITALAGEAKFNNQLASFNTVNKDFMAVRESGKQTSPEVSFSYGANVGFKLTHRILMQTGIAYRKSNSSTTSGAYIEDVNSGRRIPVVASYNYSLQGLSVVNSMDETTLTNQFEFASVPLRAGYMVLDKKLNITLLAGVSTEFFLGNNISGGGESLETINDARGADSPYKDVYFNGSTGAQLGYTLFGNYNITVEPGYRFAINSFTKDEFYLSSYPSAFMLAFGVSYIFK